MTKIIHCIAKAFAAGLCKNMYTNKRIIVIKTKNGKYDVCSANFLSHTFSLFYSLSFVFCFFLSFFLTFSLLNSRAASKLESRPGQCHGLLQRRHQINQSDTRKIKVFEVSTQPQRRVRQKLRELQGDGDIRSQTHFQECVEDCVNKYLYSFRK